MAVAAAGLVPVAHYSPAAAVSSQSIVRHDEGQPIAKLAVAAPAPVAYHAAPAVAYHAAPAVSYHAAPAAVAYHAAPAAVAYHAAPAAVAYHATPVAKVIAPAAKVLVSSQHEEYDVSRLLMSFTFIISAFHQFLVYCRFTGLPYRYFGLDKII